MVDGAARRPLLQRFIEIEDRLEAWLKNECRDPGERQDQGEEEANARRGQEGDHPAARLRSESMPEIS